MKNIGVLWDEEVSWERETPFDDRSNQTYEYFADLADKKEIKIYTGKYQWYSDGVLEKAWVFENGWKKVKNVELNAVYDKFHYGPETVPLKEEIAETVGLLNNPGLEELCKDKLMTYKKFSELVPETREASKENIDEMLAEYGKIVLKPRHAFGGEGIHIIEEGDDIPELEEEYIVQRFIDSSSGIEGLVEGYHDLRAIVVNGQLLSSYLRYNKDSEISNVQRGGVKETVSLKDFPDEARSIVEEVESKIGYDPSMFSVDFFFDEENRPWIVELNSKPGMTIYNESMREEITPVMEELLNAFEKL